MEKVNSYYRFMIWTNLLAGYLLDVTTAQKTIWREALQMGKVLVGQASKPCALDSPMEKINNLFSAFKQSFAYIAEHKGRGIVLMNLLELIKNLKINRIKVISSIGSR